MIKPRNKIVDEALTGVTERKSQGKYLGLEPGTPAEGETV